jgi:putative DNA primase/helicase
MMSEAVTVARLAKAKGLPVKTLVCFGVRDCDAGVLFSYLDPSGERGRTRLRTALRGVDGSSWLPGDDAPIVAYSSPTALLFAEVEGFQIVVEGESDCWTAWHHALPAVGIPGAENWDVLTIAHLPVTEVFIQVEPENRATFPRGVQAYVQSVAARIRAIGFTGNVYRLQFGDDADDLSQVYQLNPTDFLARARMSIRRSRQAPWDQDTMRASE